MENALVRNRYPGDGKPQYVGEITIEGKRYKLAAWEKASRYDGEGPWLSLKAQPLTETNETNGPKPYGENTQARVVERQKTLSRVSNMTGYTS